MKKVKITTTKASFLKCPSCGTKYDLLSTTGGKWLCYECNYDFGPLEEHEWIEEEVEAVVCDKCGKIIPCTPSNLILGSKYKEIACPECFDGSGLNHVIAIHYRGKWRAPDELLHIRGRNGILPVRTKREFLSLYILNHRALSEVSYFRFVSRKTHAKILWLKGKAIGYYTYSSSISVFKKPCLHQIFILPEYRRRGFGQLLFQDFLNEFKDQKVLLEEPVSYEMISLLLKLGLCKKEGEKIIATDKISFYNSGL